MDVFAAMKEYAHEQVALCHDPTCGYFGIIAIHDTTLGPALGGTRFWNYKTTDEAIIDALRLSRGMTYKAAVAGLNLGRRQVGHPGRQQADRPGDAVPGPRQVRRIAEWPVHHRGGHRDQSGRHGIRPGGDETRVRAAGPLRRPIARHRVRRVHGNEGDRQGPLGERQPRRQDGGGAGLRQGRLLPEPASEGGRRQAVRHRHRSGTGQEGGGRYRRHPGDAR